MLIQSTIDYNNNRFLQLLQPLSSGGPDCDVYIQCGYQAHTRIISTMALARLLMMKVHCSPGRMSSY